MEPKTVEEFLAERLRRRLERAADQLAELARFARECADDINGVGRRVELTSYAEVVGRFQHEINTTLMNLQVGALTSNASEADTARATKV